MSIEVGALTHEPISSPSDLMQIAESWEAFSNLRNRAPLFRGQAQEYMTLKPTLGRAVSVGAYSAATHLEGRLLSGFKKHYMEMGNLPSDMPEPSKVGLYDSIDLLALMQHYEVPTRLLDWSESIWVSAYFACASNHDSNAELWFFDPLIVQGQPDGMTADSQRESIERSISGRPGLYRDNLPLLAAIRPTVNARLEAQRGWLTASDNVQVDHMQILWKLAARKMGKEGKSRNFGRYIIKASRKRDILAYLSDVHSISAKTLFPDIVGLGRYLRWEFEALKIQIL